MLSASCTSSSDVDVHLHHVLCNGLLGAVGLLELVPEQEIAGGKHYSNFASIQKTQEFKCLVSVKIKSLPT